jgi:phosphate transport system substrate-binding protein
MPHRARILLPPALTSALLVTALGSIALAIALSAETGPSPRFLERRPAAARREPAGPGLQIAGSGSNLPLTRALVDAYLQRHPGRAVVVHESIGSTGAVRALADGVIHLGLVSRPLTAAEREAAPALRLVPYARSVVVAAAHPEVRARDVTAAQLVAMVRGERVSWDDGTPLVFLLRERGDSSQLAVARVVPAFGDAEREAQRARRHRVLYHDDAMRRALLATPGSVGLSDLGGLLAQRLPLVRLSFEGVAPTVENAARGAYPLVKDLAFVTPAEPDPEARAFLDFVASPEGRALTRASGHIPLPLDPTEYPR